MNKKFDSRLKMFESTGDVLAEYASDWTGYAPMETAVEVFTNGTAAIMAAKQAQETDIKGYAADKRDKRDGMAELAMVMCGKVRAWCRDMGDKVGYNEMHITKSMVMHGKSTSAQTLCQSIIDKANTMDGAAKASYHLTDDDFVNMQGAIDSYSAVKMSPRVAVAGRKSDTDSFKKMFTDNTLVLKEGIDNLMENFRGSQFYKDYFNARKIESDATQKATLTVTVVSEYDGSPLAGVLVACTDGVTNFEEMTDSQGRIKRTDIHPDVWDLTCTKTNFTTGTAQTDIYPGDKDKVLVKLKPV